ncbi:MAG: carboxylesterase/lipase family protein [Planctomycetota bacterium]|nr:carboxylesterase/lipase family protein [Planctomycetota bacterium]
MNRSYRWFGVGILWAVTLVSQAKSEEPVLAIESGKITGKILDPTTGLTVFKGIPYAAPPVGKRRWRPPQPVVSWKGIKHCREFGPAAPQKPPTVRQDEDCLFLNLWTKQPGNPGAKLPVMVWIHGGGLNRGSGHRPFYQGSALASRNVVLVTVNYRLGALGFLAHPALSKESTQNISGNYGFMDQIAALQWVQTNIAQFGGDPNNITIFGESAGGTSVSTLCVSRFAKGLFHKAIIQSPWMFGYINQLAEPNMVPIRKTIASTKSSEDLGVEWAKNLTDLTGKEALEYLRNLPAEELLNAMHYYPTRGTIDGVFLKGHPSQLFLQGKQHDLPVMVGTTRNEGAYFQGWIHLQGRNDFIEELAGFYGNQAESVATLYPGTTAQELKLAGVEFVTDSWFVQPARQLLEGMTQVKSPTYQYEFARSHHLNPAIGSPHAIELQYVFNTLQDAEQRPEDQKLADLISNYWTQFAKVGNPNRSGLPRWPKYESSSRQYLQLDHQTIVLKNLRKKNCDVIDQALRKIYQD